MNDRKIKFLRAVRLLAPRDTLVLQFAECVRAEELPLSPGGAALEFVVALQRALPTSSCPQRALRGLRPASHTRPVSSCCGRGLAPAGELCRDGRRHG